VRLFASIGDGSPDVDGLLRDWGLSAKRRASFASLSGDQRQRLFVVLALVNRPWRTRSPGWSAGPRTAVRREAPGPG
jgi:ABC-2 type transport system ATP-binding protein